MEECRLPERTEKPWGHEILVAWTPNYAGKVLFVKRGHRLSLQYHKRKEETLYFHSGVALVDIGSMKGRPAISGDCIQIPPQAEHRITALEDTVIFEVSTPELEDVIRVRDAYGRCEL